MSATGRLCIRDWEKRHFHDIHAETDADTDVRAEDLSAILRMGCSFKELDPQVEAQQLLARQSHNLRKSPYLWEVIQFLSKARPRLPENQMHQCVEALIRTMQEHGGIEIAGPISFIRLVAMGENVRPKTLALLVPVLKPLMENVLSITEFLGQAKDSSVWKSEEFSTVFRTDILEPIISRLNVTQNDTEHQFGISLADTKLLAERVNDFGLRECLPALVRRLSGSQQLTYDEIINVLPPVGQQEMQSARGPYPVIDLTASSPPDIKREP